MSETLTTNHSRLVADCPYCSVAYLVYGAMSLWVHLISVHPDTALGSFVASMRRSLEFSA